MKQLKHTGVYALAIKNNSVLLIKKARGPYLGKWDLPGGSLEFGEKPLVGLAREMNEETGLLIQKSKLINVLSHSVTYETKKNELAEMYHLGIIYKVLIKPGKKLKIEPDGQDSNGASWVKLIELNKKNLSPFASQSLKEYLKSKIKYGLLQ